VPRSKIEQKQYIGQQRDVTRGRAEGNIGSRLYWHLASPLINFSELQKKKKMGNPIHFGLP
jgi:hypothetical protein